MTAFILNITFESRDPVSLARFWADVTGYTIDSESTGSRTRLTKPDQRGVRHLLFLRVLEPRNDTRIHLDLAAPDPSAEVARVLQLGATLVDEPDAHGQPVWRGDTDKRWVVLRDPEGNEFCLG